MAVSAMSNSYQGPPSIGPVELFICGIQLDPENRVEDFKKKYNKNPKRMFEHGRDRGLLNVLFRAATFADVELMRFIVDRADKKALNLRCQLGGNALCETVLYRGTLETRAPLEKVITCALMLFKAGVEVTYPSGNNYIKRDFYGDVVFDVNPKDPFKFKGLTIIDKLIEIIEEKSRGQSDTSREETLVHLFIGLNVTSSLSQFINQTDSELENLESDAQVSEDIKRRQIKIFKEATEAAVFVKTTLLYLGALSQESNLSHLPKDLIEKICRHFQNE